MDLCLLTLVRRSPTSRKPYLSSSSVTSPLLSLSNWWNRSSNLVLLSVINLSNNRITLACGYNTEQNIYSIWSSSEYYHRLVLCFRNSKKGNSTFYYRDISSIIWNVLRLHISEQNVENTEIGKTTPVKQGDLLLSLALSYNMFYRMQMELEFCYSNM